MIAMMKIRTMEGLFFGYFEYYVPDLVLPFIFKARTVKMWNSNQIRTQIPLSLTRLFLREAK